MKRISHVIVIKKTDLLCANVGFTEKSNKKGRYISFFLSFFLSFRFHVSMLLDNKKKKKKKKPRRYRPFSSFFLSSFFRFYGLVWFLCLITYNPLYVIFCQGQ